MAMFEFFQKNLKSAKENTVIAGVSQGVSNLLLNPIFHTQSINVEDGVLYNFQRATHESMLGTSILMIYAGLKLYGGENLKGFMPGAVVATFLQGLILDILLLNNYSPSAAIILGTTLTASIIYLCEKILGGIENNLGQHIQNRH